MPPLSPMITQRVVFIPAHWLMFMLPALIYIGVSVLETDLSYLSSTTMNLLATLNLLNLMKPYRSTFSKQSDRLDFILRTQT